MSPELNPEDLVMAESFYAAAAAKGLEPDPDLSVSEWADEFRMLTVRSSAEPGPWHTSRTPYLRQIMDDLSPKSPWERIILMAGAQVGKSEAGNNWLGYSMHLAPAPMMIVLPTVDMARRNSKQRIGPMIEECRPLAGLVMDARAIRAKAGSQNTVQLKAFHNGGLLVMVGANSATGLRSSPSRYLFLDEVDAYPISAGKEGDPCELAVARTTNFTRRKIFITSTPTISGRSRIETYFEESDQCHLYLPCPHCGAMQTLRIEQLRWEKGEPQTAIYICEACREGITHQQKSVMLPAGEWRPTARGDGLTRGYYLPGLVSPWQTFADIAAKAEKAGNDPTKVQVFCNTVLGLPWLEAAETPDAVRLYERREAYAIGTVPAGGLLLTAGVDVQLRRLEVEIVAWGRNRESWSVDYRIFEGDTTQPAVWKNLESLLDEDFPTAYGEPLRIRKLAVDSGFNTTAVYDWVHKMGPQRVMAVKGDSRHAALVGMPSMIEITTSGKHVRYGLRLWPINSNIAKEELYRWLRTSMPDMEAGGAFPTGYCHFPMYGRAYFDQLCAEQLVTRVVGGVRRQVWEKKQDRNEALDCFDGETEVLTNEGWLNFPSINGQKLATVELETDHIEFQHPTDYIHRQHTGEMIHLRGRRLDILVTPNHRMVTYLPNRDEIRANTPGITLARDLTQRHQLKLTGRWIGSGPPCIAIPPSVKNDSGVEIEPLVHVKATDLARFYGWWITEGSVASNQWEGSTRRIVAVSQVKTPNIDAIADLLDRLPWHFYWNEQVKKFICTSKQLHDEVTQWGRLQISRRVPGWIKEGPIEVIDAFLSTAVAGDGWVQNGDCRVICTVCKELADDYQELFLKLGHAPRIQMRPAKPYSIRGRSGDNVKPQYHVHENAHIKRASLDGGGNGQRGYIGRSVAYDGEVYCATVPNGTLICRRQGQVFIAGNCRLYSRAAAASLRFETWKDSRWDDIEREITRDVTTPVAPKVSKPATPVPAFKPFRANESFLE